MLAELNHRVASFAKWRWTSLEDALLGLLDMESALRTAIRYVPMVSMLACRDVGEASDFVDAARSEVFWDKVSRIIDGALLFGQLRSWLKGCSCHEEERRKGQIVKCAWAGCRAPELASRVRRFLEELHELGHLDAHLALPESARQLCAMWRRAYAYVDSKFSWVNENPFLIWQVSLSVCKSGVLG